MFSESWVVWSYHAFTATVECQRQDDVPLLFGLVYHTYELFSAIG
jgi:hypothetical protein